jgi:hypothetical protein
MGADMLARKEWGRQPDASELVALKSLEVVQFAS